MKILLLEDNDYLIIPILIGVILYLSHLYLKKIEKTYLKRIFIFGLIFKILTSILMVVLVNYYGLGDTLNYFDDTKSLYTIIVNNPQFTFQLITKNYYELNNQIQGLFPGDYIFQQENVNSGRVATFGVIPYAIFF